MIPKEKNICSKSVCDIRFQLFVLMKLLFRRCPIISHRCRCLGRRFGCFVFWHDATVTIGMSPMDSLPSIAKIECFNPEEMKGFHTKLENYDLCQLSKKSNYEASFMS